MTENDIASWFVPLPVLKVIMAGCPSPAQFLAAISTSYRLSGCSLARVSLCREPEILLEVQSARGSPTWKRQRAWLRTQEVDMFEDDSFNLSPSSLLYLSVFDHILQHPGSSLMPWPPGEFIIVSLARAWLAEDYRGFGRQDLSWQLRAVQRQHGTRRSRLHRWLLS